MKVVIVPEAESQLATRRSWWRDNRPATRDLFLPKTRCHRYFEILEGKGEVQILAAAGSRQRRAPRIRFQDAP
jgi:hypothetical protein